MAEMDPGHQAMTLKLAQFRLVVRPGPGLVARFPGAVLLVTSSDWTGLPAVPRLLEECALAVDARSLPHRLADLVDADTAEVPSFCAVADDEEGLALFVHGDAQVVITGAQALVRLSGGNGTGWTGRIPDRAASLVIGPAAGVTDAVPADPHFDLREGVVPGSVVVLTPRIVVAPERPGAPGARAAEPAAAVDGAPAMVWGINCKRGHFNNPDARYCRMCGTHMVHKRRDPILGPRPVLGFLVLDDGSTFKLDVDYVLGRQPEHDAGVQAGDARGLALSGPEDAVSPVHAQVHLDGWDVFVSDCQSRSGTHVWTPGSAGWVRLMAGEKVKLESRTHVLVGRRSIVFDSLSGR